MLEKKIDKLGKYFNGIEKYEEGFSGVKINVCDGWTVYGKKTENYEITPCRDKNELNKYILVGTPNASVGEIMDFAYEIIMNNLERESKLSLFNVKIKELGKIFDENTLASLQNLVFKFEKPKKIKKNEAQAIDNNEPNPTENYNPENSENSNSEE